MDEYVAIKEAVPAAKILMLTVSDEESDLYEAVKSGANGYLLKDSSTRWSAGGPGGRRRPVADQPLDGGQADRQVQADVAVRPRSGLGGGSPSASSRCSASSPRG